MSTASWSKRIALGAVAVAAVAAPGAQARIYDEPSPQSVAPATVAAPTDTSASAALDDLKSSYPQFHSLTKKKIAVAAPKRKQQRELVPRSPYYPHY